VNKIEDFPNRNRRLIEGYTEEDETFIKALDTFSNLETEEFRLFKEAYEKAEKER